MDIKYNAYNVGFLTFEQFHGRKNIGSNMIRAKWVIDKWPNNQAELFMVGRKYDVIIFQKVYYIEYAKMFDGVKILDLCDPDWLHWGSRVKEMIDLCDAVTCGTTQIATYITKLTDKPVWVIPDRINQDQFKVLKQHEGELKKAVWYGYSDNFEALESALPVLIKRKIDLIVVSNKPFAAPREVMDEINVTNYPWNDTHWQEDIIEADVVINPRPTGGKWDFKSNNKTLNAWALGMPVAHNEDELDKFLSEKSRKDEASKRLAEIQDGWLVEKSVNEYQQLIKEIYANKV